MKLSNNIMLLFVIATIVLSAPYIIRNLSNNNYLINQNSYYPARLSDTISEKGRFVSDELSFGGREYFFNPFHVILSALANVLQFNLAAKLFLLVLGLVSLLIFYLILKKIGIKKQKALLSCILLAISPPFIYAFTVLTSHSFIIFLLLSCIYLFTYKKTLFSIFASFLLILISLFNIIFAVAIILLLLYFCLFAKCKKKFCIILTVIILFCLIYYFPIVYNYGLPVITNSMKEIGDFLSDTGGNTGFGIFGLILGIIGIIYTKNKNSFVYLTGLLVILSFYFGGAINLYTNFMIIFFAGNGFFYLLKKKWDSDILKVLSIIVIVCGLVFSPIAYIKSLSYSQPNQITIDSLEWIKENTDKSAVIFSRENKGFLIEYFAKRPVVMDTLFIYAPQVNQRIKDSDEIFNSYKLEKTKKLLDKYNIKYIWIDTKMKKEIWDNKRIGLLFLFRNNETFRNVYNKHGIEIWEYLK